MQDVLSEKMRTASKYFRPGCQAREHLPSREARMKPPKPRKQGIPTAQPRCRRPYRPRLLIYCLNRSRGVFAECLAEKCANTLDAVSVIECEQQKFRERHRTA